MSTHDRNTTINIYQEALKEYPRGIKSYRWHYKKEQLKRFQELLKITEGDKKLNQRSILDIGCGRGDLYQYLLDQNSQIKYTGIDLISEFITDAKSNYPRAKFVAKDFLQWRSKNRYDYIIASGLLSVKIFDNKNLLQKTIKKMLLSAQRGLGFNFLTTFRKEKFKRWYYYNPGEILNWCITLKNIKKIMFNTGYDPVDQFGDATILIFKK